MEDKLPAQIHNAYWFQGFNAVSWQLCLGSPLILFARELGASAVVLGLLAGLAPLTSMLQLFVASSAPRIGYRNLMVKGWTGRVMMLLFLTVLPLTVGMLPTQLILGLLIAVMFAFTVLRGIATCAWLPWITAIVPRSLRGSYLSRDRTFVNFASVAALVVAGAFVLNHRSANAYGIVFGFSFLGGAISLRFLKRIPEPAATPKAILDASPAHWFGLLRNAPFVRLLLLSMAVQGFVASTATFVTVFVREQVQLADGAILWVAAGAALVATFALRLVRDRVDRLGSRPLLGISFLWWIIYFGVWFLLAAGWIHAAVLTAVLLMLANGFFGATYELAFTRLLMNTVGDQAEASQYFALQSVIVSLVAGVAPILWGSVLDSLSGFQVVVRGATFGSYALFFGGQWLLLGIVLQALKQIKESAATSTATLLYRVLIDRPGHRLALLIGRHS